ncbi:hypothetical protein KA183_11240 [bacterium]|nr:hypothetical protein [bacterium]
MYTFSASKAIELTPEQIIDTVSESVKARLNLSFEEFIEKYQQGTLEDPSSVADLIMLLDLVKHEPACKS